MSNVPAKKQKQEKNLRQYQAIWDAIKAAPMQSPVQIKCHPSAVKTIIQAVKKEKTRDVAVKKKIGMPRPGTLTISHVIDEAAGKAIISFALQWDATKL